MSAYPVNDNARQRLRDAQRAEAEALAAVTRAQLARSKLQTKVDASDLAVAAAIRRLVDVSGAERTAQLLDETTRAVRRWIHLARSTPDAPRKDS
ncbi:hypothetical protein [Flexivirga alba]|uniref:Uncharacterized protein n=1 Tax=Flexivirga alba TaxID=702742 RepID=A0ABW2AJ33_9MICO